MSYTKLIYHIVFRTKGSIPAIAEEHERMLYGYILGFFKGHKCVLYRIGGMPDHIHILAQLPIAEHLPMLVRDLKTATNFFIQKNKDKFPLFCGWGRSYCAITVSPMQKDAVVEYIKGQKTHHRAKPFRDELLEILNDNGMEVDMRYFMVE